VSDWLVAMDDWLTLRLTRCTLCGGPDPILRGIMGTRALIVGYSLCARCMRADGVRRAEQLLEARYEAGALGDDPMR
jgi:hypothetical protein